MPDISAADHQHVHLLIQRSPVNHALTPQILGQNIIDVFCQRGASPTPGGESLIALLDIFLFQRLRIYPTCARHNLTPFRRVRSYGQG